MSDKLTLWFKAARGYTFGLSAVPYLLGSLLASANYFFNLKYCILGFIALVIVHASFNLLDDYFDWTSKKVNTYKEPEFPQNTRLHKAFYLEEKLISPKTVLFVVGLCWIIALVIGIFLALKINFTIIQIAMFGAFLAMAYTLEPIALNSKGLGELTIGIIFGPLIMSGAYLVSGALQIDLLCLLTSAIFGLLIANTAHTHSILDYDADLKNNKRTLSICLLSKEKAIFVQLLLYILAYMFLFLGIVYNIYPKEALLALFTFPMAIELNELMFNKETEPKLWYGPITQLKENIDNYFMLRLCLARNIVIFFALYIALTYYLYS